MRAAVHLLRTGLAGLCITLALLCTTTALVAHAAALDLRHNSPWILQRAQHSVARVAASVQHSTAAGLAAAVPTVTLPPKASGHPVHLSPVQVHLAQRLIDQLALRPLPSSNPVTRWIRGAVGALPATLARVGSLAGLGAVALLVAGLAVSPQRVRTVRRVARYGLGAAVLGGLVILVAPAAVRMALAPGETSDAVARLLDGLRPFLPVLAAQGAAGGTGLYVLRRGTRRRATPVVPAPGNAAGYQK